MVKCSGGEIQTVPCGPEQGGIFPSIQVNDYKGILIIKKQTLQINHVIFVNYVTVHRLKPANSRRVFVTGVLAFPVSNKC